MPDDFEDIVPVLPEIDRAAQDAELERLAALDTRAYQSERKAAARALGWQVAFLDTEVQKLRPAETATGSAEGAEGEAIETLEPWPDPVDGASLAEEIRDRIASHVVFTGRHDADLVALWCLGAYCMDVWRLWPKLLITSPTRQCGKSTLMEVLEASLPRAVLASNASPAAIFRSIEAWAPSLLLDEADTWLRQNEELAGIVNSGHTRRTARVLRVVDTGGDLEPRSFATWCPMVVAGIGDQRDTLTSRSIVIALRRKLPDEATERLPVDLFERMLRVRRQAVRWAFDNAVTLKALDLDPPPCGDDRKRDNFGPLYRIAAVLRGDWPARLEAGYLARAERDDDAEEPAGVMLLRDLAEMFASSRADRLPTSEIVAELLTMDDRPWLDWRHGKGINANALAKLLRPYGIAPRTFRLPSGGTPKGYMRTEVDVAAARYCGNTQRADASQAAAQTATPQQCPEINALPKSRAATTWLGVAVSDAANALKNNECFGVAVPKPDPDALDPDAWR